MTEGMNVKDYDYDLPEELIAQDPLEDRSSSRLMVLDHETGEVEHRHFTDILEYLHPGRKANVIYDGTVIGYLGEVHPTVAANYAIKERVYVAVIDMPEIVSRASFDYKYEGITNFPVSSRDLSMVVPKDILVGDIEKIFDQRGGKYLESYELFDVYEGEQIEKGFKSVAYSLKFRGKDKNLEESDITSAMKKILNGLEGMGIQLRG